MIQPQPLDSLTLPLLGVRLIEASAGTGKTFTIAALYLRLLLGLGGGSAFPRPLSVDEILVVTFTEAATEELRGRIRDNIHRLRTACICEGSDDPLLATLLAQIPSLPEAAGMLLAAERQMDEAAIYTIHGFCQRMLIHNAFESGVLFSQTLIQDELPLRRQACADFWRRHCYPLPLAVARAVNKEWSGPEALLEDLSPYLQGEAPQLNQPPGEEETLETRHQQIVELIDQLKQLWRDKAADLASLISASGVNKRSYSRSNLPKWLQKVTEWAEQETTDYALPKELERFRQSELTQKSEQGDPPRHSLFIAIDELYQANLSLRDLLLARALIEIRISVQQEKRLRAEMGFDDLLSRLDSALQGGNGGMLAQMIRQCYPVAMIDEFQDTDPQQYRIFRTLYTKQPQCALLLIGDPKQAIYAFRGADIFTYMQARKEVTAHYTLETNWRSAPGLVSAVNRLFSRSKKSFVFSDIPFYPVEAAEKNQGLCFEYQGGSVVPCKMWLHPGAGVGSSEYQQLMARQCAVQIRDWLQAGQQGAAWLVRDQQRSPLAAADITILVRNRIEAALMQDALNALAIPSVYLSNRESVFSTPEARDLLWLLQAVLAPEQERALRCTLASNLMGLNAATIAALNQDQPAWDALVDEFAGYRQHWLQRGVLPMLREVLARRQLAETILAGEEGERRLTDLLHLGELLQEAAITLESEHSLVRWLAQQIVTPNPQADNQQLRLESDRHLVQVVTIHKSKGLDYPLVWLPFASGFRAQKQALYHDRQDLTARLDLSDSPQALAWAEEERLAEDLRLLYVALTRAVYHCSIGVAPLITGNRKKEGQTDLHHSALGYLLQQGCAGDAQLLVESLQQLASDDITIQSVEMLDQQLWQGEKSDEQQYAARHINRILDDGWRVTSYSGLQQFHSQQQSSPVLLELLPRLELEASGGSVPIERQQQFTAHSFPRGATAGTFLHDLLEKLDFNALLDTNWLADRLRQQGLAEAWLPALQHWLEDILATPLSPDGLCLSQLTAQQRQVEMQFYLPIAQPLTAQQLDHLIKRYDPLSARCPTLSFRQVHGMLKGFIDLLFCWQGRYYLLDYKSNWLGEEGSAYQQSAMEQAMMEHRYDLQYQLYALALHRLLRQRLQQYDYQRHFGGVFYLFLRGLSPDKPGQGVFYCRPAEALISEMDQLFSAEQGEKEMPC